MRDKEKKAFNKNDLDRVSSLYKSYILKDIESKTDRIKNRYIKENRLNNFNELLGALSDPPNINSEQDSFFDNCFKYSLELDYIEDELLKILNNEKDTKNSNIISDYDFQSELIKDLLLKIQKSIEIIASPLSNEIFELKKGYGFFTKSFINWKEEMTDENSPNNYHNVISSYTAQSENFTNLGSKISNDFKSIIDSLNQVSTMFNKISDDTKKIEDIASNIKTLSINASIEAARAGIHGKGFKVIATGTHQLSEQTNTLLKSIVNSVKETKNIIKTTEENLITESQTIVSHIGDQNSGYHRFYNVLQDFYSKFEIVFNDVIKGTQETSRHIDKVMPMVQLHDGLEQQLGNIAALILKLNVTHSSSINETLLELPEDVINERKNNIVTNFENQITTDIEVEVLSDIVKKHHLDRYKKIETISNEIEFF